MFLGDCITQQQFTISNNQRLIQLATQIREFKCSTAEQEEGWLPLQGHCIIDNVWLYPLYYSKIVPSIVFKNVVLSNLLQKGGEGEFCMSPGLWLHAGWHQLQQSSLQQQQPLAQRYLSGCHRMKYRSAPPSIGVLSYMHADPEK